MGFETVQPPNPNCPWCNGTGSADSGGVTPWGAGIDIRCSCTYETPEQLKIAIEKMMFEVASAFGGRPFTKMTGDAIRSLILNRLMEWKIQGRIAEEGTSTTCEFVGFGNRQMKVTTNFIPPFDSRPKEAVIYLS